MCRAGHEACAGCVWVEHSASVHRKPLGFDTQLGIAVVWPSARIGFAFVQRSREFAGQDRPDRFGQLALSFAI